MTFINKCCHVSSYDSITLNNKNVIPAKAGISSLFAVLILTLLLSLITASDAVSSEMHLIYSPSPVETFGGSMTGEYDRRYIGEDFLLLQRAMFSISYTMRERLGLWAEIGAANLTLTTDEETYKGEYGFAFGGGFVYEARQYAYMDWSPFVSMRAIQFQTFIVQARSGAVATEVHRKFVWQEGYTHLGAGRDFDKFRLYVGTSMRLLFQDEFRQNRTAGNIDKRQYIYNSGIKAGALGMITIPLEYNLTLRIGAEIFPSAQRLTVSIGQGG